MRQFKGYWTRLSAVVATSLVFAGCGNSDPGDLFRAGTEDGGSDASIPDASALGSSSASSSSVVVSPDGGPSSTVSSDADVDATASSSTLVAPDSSVPDTDGATSATTVPSASTLPTMSLDGGDGAVPPEASASTAPSTSASTSIPPDGGFVPDAADTSTPPPVCAVAFVDLVNGLDLTLSDDEDSTCANEIQMDVQVATNLLDGAEADLSVGSADPVRATAAGGQFLFPSVSFTHNDTTTLNVVVVGDSNCAAAVTVDGVCPVGPSCEITLPVLSADKPALNGLAAPSGDNLNPGGAFHTQFVVTTDLPDASLVLLDIDEGASTVAAFVNGGVADFSSVALGEDGPHTVVATCNGETSTDSAPLSVPVDTVGPTLVTNSITPVDNQHYSPQQDVDGGADGLQFDVCVPVSSPDAVDLTGTAANNVCVAIGAQAPTCAPATSSNSALGGQDGGCVRLDCPGNASFALNVAVKDAAGNPTSHAIAGVTCASSEPLVQIVSLVDATSDTADVSKHLLSSGAANGQLKDESANTAGAQHSLVACTSAASGTARALAGLQGGALSQKATVTLEAAQMGDNCPSGLNSVARFNSANIVTLPESSTSPALKLTEVVVEVTDETTESNQSDPVRLWVDSVAPTITLLSPGGLCGSGVTSAVDVTRDLVFVSNSFPQPLSLTVENGGNTSAPYTFTSTSAQTVDLPLGTNVLHGTMTDVAGNTSIFHSDDCQVFVGNPPMVTWVSPAPGTTVLNAATTSPASGTVQDADENTAGWQGTLSVTIGNLQAGDVASGQVQFAADGVALGSPIALSSGTGDASTRTVSLDLITVGGLDDDADVTLSAAVTGTLTSGASSLANLVVDTTLPTAAENLVPAIGPNPGDRRRTRFQLSWDGAGDGALGDEDVEGYAVTYSETGPIDDQTEFDAAFAVHGLTLGTLPASPGSPESMLVDGLTIEHVYYFAIQAFDEAGNLGPVVPGAALGTDAPGLAARFQTNVLAHPGNIEEKFGFALDGSTDLTGDGFAELIVTAFNPDTDSADPANPSAVVYIYKGSVSGYSQVPLVTITGDYNTSFGYSVAVVGDINDDTPPSATATQVAHAKDIVVTAQVDTAAGVYGAAYVFFGRDWDSPANQNLVHTDADAIISTGGPDFLFGEVDSVVQLGDFNSDGVDDFGLGHYFYSPDGFVTSPGAVSVILGKTGFSSLTLSDDSSFGADALLLRGTGELSFGGTSPITALSNGAVVGTGLDSNYAPGNAAIFDPTTSAITEYSAAHAYAGLADANFGEFGWGLMAGNGLAAASPLVETYPRTFPDNPGMGQVDVFLRDNSAFPFDSGQHFVLFDRNVTSGFGRVTLGNGFAGRSGALPFVGATANQPNLVLGGINAAGGGPPPLHILSAATLTGFIGQGSVDLGDTGVSDVYVNLKALPGAPQTWANGAQGAAIRDVNGDGYADIAIGESTLNATPYDGHVIVLY